MVGIAGKSPACKTCRQRRIKCDLRRPACLKCITSKRACTGYGRGIIFVNRTPSCLSATATSVLSCRAACERLLKDNSADLRTEANLRRLFSESGCNGREFRQYAASLLEAIYLPQNHVSRGPKSKADEGSFSWAYCLTDLVRPSKPLDTSLFAFCLVQLHITGQGSTSLYQCLDQYNAALQHLHSDLNDFEQQSQDETLAAILVLSTCELFLCPAENGWGVHARGIAEILRLRNPEMTSTPTWKHLFSRLRIVCTLEALTKREADILRNDMWRRIVTESGFEGILDEVYRIVADVPAILEQAVALESIDDPKGLFRESGTVIRLLLGMVTSIEAWNDAFARASPTSRAWLVPSHTENPADVGSSNKVFPSCFEFESLSVAVAVVMCWAVATQLHSNIIQIHGLVRARLGRHITLGDLLAQVDSVVANEVILVDISSGDASLSTSEKGDLIENIQNEGAKMAHNVCRSLEYFHRVEMGTYGSHAATYPTWSARQFFRLHPGHERERLWIEKIHEMEGPGTRWGLSMMAFADIAEPLSAAVCQDKKIAPSDL
ncbi:hypothetical protein M426DRAFT_321498 [Hypoxylon sp. CI-4A]|nr:hypothetical protein M426DRAFT_321498 [Hypoxylon sp. CI-4A]